METQNKILAKALELFFKYGIKRVTMDDIAKELGMSKKTIYQFYSEKDELINQLCENETAKNECEFDELHKLSKDPVHEIMLISVKMSEMMQHINPMFFLDLQKFHPHAMLRFQKFKTDCAFRDLKRNIIKGKELGIYRNDIDPDFAAKYRLSQMDLLMFGNSFSFEKISFSKSNQIFLDMFVYGICTVKGHKLINKYKQIKEEE